MGLNTVQPELLVRCDCGFEAQGIEGELILIVEEHAIEAHNVDVTYERVLAMMRPAPEAAPPEPATSRVGNL